MRFHTVWVIWHLQTCAAADVHAAVVGKFKHDFDHTQHICKLVGVRQVTIFRQGQYLYISNHRLVYISRWDGGHGVGSQHILVLV